MKRILLTLMTTIVGSLSANIVAAGPSFGVVIGIPPIVIGAPLYRPAPVYYPPAPVAYQVPRPYYAPAPVYYPPAPIYGARPVVLRPAPGYYAPVVVAPGYYGRNGHYNRGYYRW